MRAILAEMAQAIHPSTSQNDSTQSMMAQANWDVAPGSNQQLTTMASRLRGFTRINPHIFYGSKVDEDLQEFHMKSTMCYML